MNNTDPTFKTRVLTARVAPALQAAIDKAAKKTGQTRTDFVVSAVKKELTAMGYKLGVLG